MALAISAKAIIRYSPSSSPLAQPVALPSAMKDHPLKVLFLNTRDRLGADVAVQLTIARALDRSQVGVWAATSIYESPGPSARAAFASIPELVVLPLDLGRPLLGQGGLARMMSLLENGRGAANLISLARLCRREGIDVIHVTERPRDALFGLLLARLAGCACLIHAHTNFYRHDATPLGDKILRHVDAIVGVSNFTANTFRRDAALSIKQVYSLHNAVDTTIFGQVISRPEGLEMRRYLDIPTNVPLIGCVSRLSRWKDQATLLEALVLVQENFPDVHLVLAGVNSDISPDGDGDYKDYLIRRISALSLEKRVKFTGFLDQYKMPRFYAALDVLAHPAIEEPFGLALVEGMISARPVVAIGAGGVPEIIRHGIDGLLVSPGQPASLAAALIKVLNNPAFAEQLSYSGRERVLAAFTPEIQANAMVDIYRSLVTVRMAGSLVKV